MRFAYQPSFLQTTARLSRVRAARLFKSIQKFQTALEIGQWPVGLGMTHLRGDCFEFRVDLHRRVLYHRTGDLVTYILYGSHDDVRRFLKRL